MSLTKLATTMLLGATIKTAAGVETHIDKRDSETLLRAIAQVETGWIHLDVPCRRVGRHGERSAFQITRANWQRYTTAPFTHASTDAALARQVAEAHLRWLAEQLAKRDLIPTTYYLALGWNGGTGAWRSYPGIAVMNYAERVVALSRAIRIREHTEITIVPGHQAGKVWLQHRDGEGGEFSAAQVAAVMDDPARLREFFEREM